MDNMKKFLHKGKKKSKNLLFTVVVLIEIIALLVASTYCWVETVSTIWISGEGNIDTFTYSKATINNTSANIDLTKYFREAGNVHLASASSVDGKNFYFPVVKCASGAKTPKYRLGTLNDANVNYISFSLDVTSQSSYDYVFEKVPRIFIGDTQVTDKSVVRMSITDETDNVTKIFSMGSFNGNVVSSVNAGTAHTTVYSFKDYINGNSANNKIFSITANQTKRITISLWLQVGISIDNTSTPVTGKNVKIDDLAIVPSAPTYDVIAYAVTGTSYNDSTGGTVQIGNGKAGANAAESIRENGTVTLKATEKIGYKFVGWYKSITGGTAVNKSASYTFTVTSSGTYYARFEIAYKVTAYAMLGSQNNITAGTVSVGNSNPGQIAYEYVGDGDTVTLKATVNNGYIFKGWYASMSDREVAKETSTTYIYTVQGEDATLFARYAVVYNVQACAVTDGQSYNSSGGTVRVGSSADGAYQSQQIQYGYGVTLTATVKNGYAFEGWYSAPTGGQLVYSSPSYPISNVTADQIVYARFKKTVSPYMIYFKANHWDDKDSPWFAVYVWDSNNNNNKWFKLNHIKDDIYGVDLGAYYPNAIFCRMNPSTSNFDWNYCWDQSVDLSVSSEITQSKNNMFTPYTNSWDGTGTWSTYQ